MGTNVHLTAELESFARERVSSGGYNNVSEVVREGLRLLVAERPMGTISRQVFLSDTLETDRLEARYDNGVLTLTIPVAETGKPRKFEITGVTPAAAQSEPATPAAEEQEPATQAA